MHVVFETNYIRVWHFTEWTSVSISAGIFSWFPTLNTACFTAATWDYSNGQVSEQDFKGCSAFNLETNTCSKVEIGSSTQDTCKETCDTNSCNSVTPKRGISCHTCQVTFNSLNQTIGFGDPDCFENPSEDSIQNCPQGEGSTDERLNCLRP